MNMQDLQFLLAMDRRERMFDEGAEGPEHWVTMKGHHVLIDDKTGQSVQNEGKSKGGEAMPKTAGGTKLPPGTRDPKVVAALQKGAQPSMPSAGKPPAGIQDLLGAIKAEASGQPRPLTAGAGKPPVLQNSHMISKGAATIGPVANPAANAGHTLGGKGRPLVDIGQELQSSLGLGKLTVPTLPDGKVDPSLHDAYKGKAAEMGLEVGDFQPTGPGRAAASIGRKGPSPAPGSPEAIQPGGEEATPMGEGRGQSEMEKMRGEFAGAAAPMAGQKGTGDAQPATPNAAAPAQPGAATAQPSTPTPEGQPAPAPQSPPGTLPETSHLPPPATPEESPLFDRKTGGLMPTNEPEAGPGQTPPGSPSPDAGLSGGSPQAPAGLNPETAVPASQTVNQQPITGAGGQETQLPTDTPPAMNPTPGGQSPPTDLHHKMLDVMATIAQHHAGPGNSVGAGTTPNAPAAAPVAPPGPAAASPAQPDAPLSQSPELQPGAQKEKPDATQAAPNVQSTDGLPADRTSELPDTSGKGGILPQTPQPPPQPPKAGMGGEKEPPVAQPPKLSGQPAMPRPGGALQEKPLPWHPAQHPSLRPNRPGGPLQERQLPAPAAKAEAIPPKPTQESPKAAPVAPAKEGKPGKADFGGLHKENAKISAERKAAGTKNLPSDTDIARLAKENPPKPTQQKRPGGPLQERPLPDTPTNNPAINKLKARVAKPQKAFTPAVVGREGHEQDEAAQDAELSEAAGAGHPYTFHGKLPGEVEKFLEGNRGARKLFKTTNNPSEAGGADAYSQLGEKYFQIAARHAAPKGANQQQAREDAHNSPDPDVKFRAALGGLRSPKGEKIPKQEKFDPKTAQDGQRMTTRGGIPLRVTKDENDEPILQDGPDLPETPIAALQGHIPIDAGSLKHEDPEAGGGGSFNPDELGEPEAKPPQRVDPSRQYGLYSKDASGNPAEVGEKPGQANLFDRSKLPASAPAPATERIGSASANDPKHTPSMFPTKSANPSTPAAPQPQLTPESLMKEFNQLHGNGSHAGPLPAHVLRSHIAKTYGEKAASHEVLDPMLRALRGKQLRLVGGTHGSLTPEMAEGAVHGAFDPTSGSREVFGHLEPHQSPEQQLARQPAPASPANAAIESLKAKRAAPESELSSRIQSARSGKEQEMHQPETPKVRPAGKGPTAIAPQSPSAQRAEKMRKKLSQETGQEFSADRNGMDWLLACVRRDKQYASIR